jgi:uncharacterized protein (TIGR03435 family)
MPHPVARNLFQSEEYSQGSQHDPPSACEYDSAHLAECLGQDSEVRFEVASVKPSDPAAQGSTFSFNRGTSLRVISGTLKALIEMAFDVRSFQISGGPGWLDSDRYDLLAMNTTDDPPGVEGASPNDRLRLSRLRLQALLADRFQLKIHRATQDRSAYALTVAKSGTKLQNRPADDDNMELFTDCGRSA